MGKKQAGTPRSRVRSALRKLWLSSRERAAALKAAGYCCDACGVKQSKAKGQEQAVEVHHTAMIVAWEQIIDSIFQHILVHPAGLQVLCPDCHDEHHTEQHQ
jgi:predicted HNH restriction endonuclease